MNIQFSNWKLIDLNALDSGITNAFTVFDTIYNSFDATNFFVDSVTNTRVTGTSGIYNVLVLGNNFTTDVPFETYSSISLINSTNTAEQLLTTGSVTYNYNTDSYTGFYNKISYVSNNTPGLTNLLIEGRFNVDVFGDTIGGTANKYNVTFNGNTINLTGSMILDANDDIVGGTISSFTFADNQGRTLTASGLSISAVDFYRLTDPTPPNSFLTLDAFYNYLTDASRLAGNDIIIANASDTQSDTLNGFGGNDTLGGGGGNDTLNGGIGIDILDGGTGTDTMEGGDGNDTYIVDNSSDIVIETNASSVGGIDTVRANLANGQTYVLTPNVENLILTDGSTNGGTANSNGTGNALNNVITGNAGNNELNGAAGNDTLLGGLGNDTLTGGAGLDALTGGKGDDTYNIDLIRTSALATSTVALQDTVSELANPLVGNPVEGIDTINLINLTGNAGIPTDFSNITTVTTLNVNANIENFNASQTGNLKLNITGNTLANIITGNDADNILLGGGGNDTLFGGAGTDSLDGGLGVDSLQGHTGNDTYIVDIIAATAGTPALITGVNLEDSIIELDGLTGGVDTLKLRGSVVIPALAAATNIDLANNLALTGIENIDISQTGSTRLNIIGNSADNILTGNAANNGLDGRDGNDTLDGGAGTDFMDGGAGNDTYVVDNIGDVISDISGNDTAVIRLTTGTYVFNPDSEIENMILAGTAAISVTGTRSTNTLTGNAAANILNGGGGNDTLRGGDGNDTYIIDSDDIVIETNDLAAGGIDTVRVNLQFGESYTLTSNIENLVLIETINANSPDARFNGTGNALNNVITGNAGNNELNGAAGNDTLLGGLGNDTLTGGAGLDALTGGKGDDTYNIDLIRTSALATSTVALQDTVSELANPLVGNPVEGIDTINLINLTGNAGVPTDFSNITTVTTLNVNANIENFNASQTGNLKLNITGNTLANIITGNTGDNVLDGGASTTIVDRLIGGAGNDTYVVDITTTGTGDATTFAIQDIFTESAGQGTDTLRLRGTLGYLNARTLLVSDYAAQSIEGLDVSLTGAARINLTGNGVDNILVGNAFTNTLIGEAGDDILDGKVGADILNGGDGDDTYVIDNIADVVLETGNDLFDTIRSTIAINLNTTLSTTNSALKYDNIENVTLTGAAAINATGNGDVNELIGNDGNNILDGGVGADYMDGGKGADTYIVDSELDEVSELFTQAQGGGIDLVKSSVTFVLDDNIENLTLTGTSGIDGTGNDLANTIIGNAGANRINGDDGADRMTGGDGGDTYFVDNVGDVVTEANPNALIGGIDTVNSEISYTLGANLENLTLTGDDDINGTGNTLTNIITGNAGDNVLDGGASKTIVDTLIGDAGNDTYVVDLTVTGTGDTTAFTIQDTVTESAGQGTDTLRLRGTLGYLTARTLLVSDYAVQSIEGLDVSLTGAAKIHLTGNSADNILVGNAFTNTLVGDAGNDILDGKAGADILNGGAGDDTYFVDVIKPTTLAVGDVIIEDNIALNFGNDTVNTTFSANLTTAQFDGIENLTLLGAAALSATGDDGDNELIGNIAANIIIGGAGNDEITGGSGNDTLTGGFGADTFVWELADKGTNGRPAIDRVTDFNIAEDRLDLRDLLEGEPGANILNFVDVTTSTAAGVTNTEIRISNTGGFTGGTFAAAAENQHITLVGVNLLTGTNETDLLQSLITQNKLIIDG